LKTYNPKKVIFTFLGQLITGYADGTFVTVEQASDAFSTTIGADGEAARSQSADESGTFKIVLLQTSAANDILSAALARDRQTGLNTGPAMLKDASGRSLAIANEAWVQKVANIEFGKEIVGREWTIASGSIKQFVGGN
jgi:hypothetical protein